MNVIYNPELKGWQVVYARLSWVRPQMRGKPATDKVFESQAAAWDYLDRIA